MLLNPDDDDIIIWCHSAAPQSPLVVKVARLLVLAERRCLGFSAEVGGRASRRMTRRQR